MVIEELSLLPAFIVNMGYGCRFEVQLLVRRAGVGFPSGVIGILSMVLQCP